jgi:hypothetical protein
VHLVKNVDASAGVIAKMYERGIPQLRGERGPAGSGQVANAFLTERLPGLDER